MINCSLQQDRKSPRRLKQPQKQQSAWEKILQGILRPPRSNYKESSLGARAFVLNEVRFERKEYYVNYKASILTLTLYETCFKNDWIILYLHGNSSSRLESTTIIQHLPFHFSLAAFDFIGCGLNHQDDKITLGVRESEQVEAVVKHLSLSGWKIILWGRSMGAATALKYGKAPIIVADSAYSSFKNLCKQKMYQNTPKYIPNCLICCIFPCIFCKLRSDIYKRGEYDINQLDIIEYTQKIDVETLIIFISGDEDTLIDKRHSQKLFNSFRGKKKYLEIFRGTHNTKRPDETLKKIMAYIAYEVDKRAYSTSKETENENALSSSRGRG